MQIPPEAGKLNEELWGVVEEGARDLDRADNLCERVSAGSEFRKTR